MVVSGTLAGVGSGLHSTWLVGTAIALLTMAAVIAWRAVRDMSDFDANNHWLIDRGDGRPSVNLVVLAFVNPLNLLDQTTDRTDFTESLPNTTGSFTQTVAHNGRAASA